MKRSKISLLFDNTHFLFISIILLILCLRYWYFIFVFIIFNIFLFKKTSLFYLNLILSIVIVVSSSRYFIKFDKEVFSGVVIECSCKSAVINTDGMKVLIYHKNELSLGDYGEFKIKKIDYDTELFNYSDYLANKDIKAYYELISFNFINNYFVIGKIQEFFCNVVDNNPSLYKNYIKMLVFAQKEDDSILEVTNNLGISHLMAVSGMHVALLILFLEFILKKIFYYEKPVDIIVILFLIFYLFVTNFELTVLRAVLMVLFKKLFQYKKLYFTQLDTLSICGILLLIINPRVLFLLSFELSFLVSFIIVIFTKNFKIENKIIQTYITSFIAFLVTLPFIINTNYEVNLLSILVGPLYVLYFELLLYPATLIMMFVPNIHILFDYIFIFFESSLNALDSIKNLILIFGKLDLFSFILYEIILYFLLVSFEVKRGRILLSLLMAIFLIFVYNKAFFNPFYTLKMYDVGQGDSLLLTLPYNSGNILFDCYNNIDIHLKRDGIKDIDIIFLSHGHDDHINAFEEIVSSYNVSKIYSSYYDNTTLLNDLKDRYEIKLLKSDQRVIYKDFVCEVLGPIKMYTNENDNSLVLKVMIDDLSILFTGDIEKMAEKDLVDKYGDKLKSDILKAPHHGSSTSSSKEFLDCVDPEFILISVGRNNKYNFPNNKYLLTLNNIYRTDLENSITIYKRKKLFYIK